MSAIEHAQTPSTLDDTQRNDPRMRALIERRDIYTSDHIHAYEDVRRAVLDQGIERIAPVLVCSGAWLGENVVCPGVRIGRGAVIGANSVVVDDVPDYGLAVSAPARVVKQFGSTSLELAG